MQKMFMWFKIYSKVNNIEDNRVVSINKNKEPEIDTLGFMSKTIDFFPILERDILRLSLGLGELYEIMHSCDEI